jgi:enolase
VRNVEEIIAPAVIGMDASNQRAVDEVIIKLDGTPMKTNLGGNATASVSAATLKAGAASLGIPLYQHIGGVNACIMPVPGVITVVGSTRYGGGSRSGGKPSYSIMCYGFDCFSDAAYAAWEASSEFSRLLQAKIGAGQHTSYGASNVPAGLVKHDRELWDLMVEAIANTGYEGRMGIQVDVAAGTYWEPEKQRFVGLFSAEDKTRDDLIELYKDRRSPSIRSSSSRTRWMRTTMRGTPSSPRSWASRSWATTSLPPTPRACSRGSMPAPPTPCCSR